MFVSKSSITVIIVNLSWSAPGGMVYMFVLLYRAAVHKQTPISLSYQSSSSLMGHDQSCSVLKSTSPLHCFSSAVGP